MRRLPPYQLGLWLTAYVNGRCPLCRIHPCARLPSASQYPAVARRALLCAACHQHITWLPAPFEVDFAIEQPLVIQAATYYDYPIRQAISAFKQHEDLTRLPILVHLLRQLPRPKGCHAGNSVIVPMPTTDARLIKRGFDPVTVLSQHLSHHWRIPLWHGAVRTDNTVSQRGLSRAERLSNLDNAFDVNTICPARHLLLFDDVATTGASLQALARTLITHHPRASLTAFALAHGSQDR
ncbi:ComF family protein [Psychrobacter aestuarii]|uniref:ComF family protein n=1 Tax=Psychrobacter aestuarii TaxID=556327 RepID=UPI001D114D45|nr:ComF family protein [Psychrobacter aestuarii]